ncbi:uncharacterized protein TrAFT101_008282 [Trichoderma asperellum]|uniref:uncharacterized protein n=1 Tax=Trichoderma asperellum TaxID=101201 RepID=UPI00331D4389|nr:hypothetical protein TrAFT101_008282 [Trichoderma asperellum]
MVWPAPKLIEPPPNVATPSSSLVPHRRLSIGRLHRTASPVRVSSNNNSDSSASSSSQRDWQHHRQQQWLDLIPYDPPTPSPPLAQHQYESTQQSSSSSMPSTAIPPGYNQMPGSYYSDFEVGSPSSEEEDMFRLVHGHSPSTTNPFDSPLELQQEPRIHPFTAIPSAQPRSSFHSSSSPPPFTNMSTYSTQAATSLPSPPTSQLERPESPLSVADSQPTLRQGVSRALSPPMSPIPRPQNRASGGSSSRYARSPEDVDAQALNAVVDGIGRMQVNMNLDPAGRWRIARRPGAPC